MPEQKKSGDGQTHDQIINSGPPSVDCVLRRLSDLQAGQEVMEEMWPAREDGEFQAGFGRIGRR